MCEDDFVYFPGLPLKWMLSVHSGSYSLCLQPYKELKMFVGLNFELLCELDLRFLMTSLLLPAHWSVLLMLIWFCDWIPVYSGSDVFCDLAKSQRRLLFSPVTCSLAGVHQMLQAVCTASGTSPSEAVISTFIAKVCNCFHGIRIKCNLVRQHKKRAPFEVIKWLWWCVCWRKWTSDCVIEDVPLIPGIYISIYSCLLHDERRCLIWNTIICQR